jgi:hypothetical protein
MVDWIMENAMPKGAQYGLMYSKEPLLGCDPTPGYGFSLVETGGRRERRSLSQEG